MFKFSILKIKITNITNISQIFEKFLVIFKHSANIVKIVWICFHICALLILRIYLTSKNFDKSEYKSCVIII